MASVPEQEAYGPERERDPFDDLFAPVGNGVDVVAGEPEPGDGYEAQVEGAGEDVVCDETGGEVDEGFEFWGGEDIGYLFEGHGWEDEG